MRRLARVWALPLWAHTAVLAALLVALVPFMHLNDPAWVDDEGLYGLQVEALRGGSWEYEYAGEAFDPEHRWFPFLRGTHGEEGFYPYIKHPAFPAAVAQATRVTGPGIGVFALPVLGLVASAAAAWLLAGEIEPRGSRAAFWLVAVGPQIVNAYTLWAHTLSAAIAGLGMWAGVRIVRYGPTRWNALGLIAALAAGVLLRTEAILFAAAFTLVIGAVLVWRRRFQASLLIVVGAGLATGLAVVLERWWMARVAGVPADVPGLQATTAGRSLWQIIEGRVGAMWRIVFDGALVVDRLDRFVVAALAVIVVSGLALRLRGREGQFFGATIAAVGVASAVVLYGHRFGSAVDVAPGFFAAWPVALFGLAVMPWRALLEAERVLVATAGLFAGAVFITQYDIGGGAEWGGRFLSPVIVPLAALIAVGLVRRLADRRWPQQLAVGVAVVALAVFPATRGIETIRTLRQLGGDIEVGIREAAVETVVVDNPDLLWVPAGLWRLDDVDWFVSFGHAEELLDALAGAGVEEVTVFTNPAREALQISSYERAREVTTPELEARGVPVVVVSEPTGGEG